MIVVKQTCKNNQFHDLIDEIFARELFSDNLKSVAKMATDDTLNSGHGESNLIKRYFSTLQQWKDMDLWTPEQTSKDPLATVPISAKKRKRSIGEDSGAKKKTKGLIPGARPWDRNAFLQRLSTFSISRSG